ncbi:MAG: sulfurtransferase-like selenium metabolism protein YedF [Rikenellaceae bacterium]
MVIDARGLSCPQPLIETKKVIDKLTEKTDVEVLLDNDIAICNVEEYLSQLGITPRRDGNKICFTAGGDITINEGVATTCNVKNGNDYAVVINTLTMGHGSDELGGILLKAFVSTLSQSDALPSHIIFYNEGVKCTIEGSGFVDVLRDMDSKGVTIIVCGTCVDYYGVKEKISVGIISNMYKIVQVMQSASKVVYP